MSEHDHQPGEHGAPLTETQLRVRALESLLVEKGLVDPAALDALIDTYETKVGPRNGVKIVARACRCAPRVGADCGASDEGDILQLDDLEAIWTRAVYGRPVTAAR